MDFLRTPDERFQNLEAYPFAANYINVDDGEGGELIAGCVASLPENAHLVRVDVD